MACARELTRLRLKSVRHCAETELWIQQLGPDNRPRRIAPWVAQRVACWLTYRNDATPTSVSTNADAAHSFPN